MPLNNEKTVLYIAALHDTQNEVVLLYEKKSHINYHGRMGTWKGQIV
jgi:hypothetical protein